MASNPHDKEKCFTCERELGGGNVQWRRDGHKRCRSCEEKRQAALPSSAPDEFPLNRVTIYQLAPILRQAWRQLDAEGRREVLGHPEIEAILRGKA